MIFMQVGDGSHGDETQPTALGLNFETFDPLEDLTPKQQILYDIPRSEQRRI
jgi:hypothetical protein